MAFDITIGQFHPADSLVHRLDPRIKTTLLLVLVVAVFFADGFAGLGLVLLFLLAVMALSALTPGLVLKAAAPLCILLVFPLLFNVFFTPDGTPLVSWGVVHITDEGLYRALFMTLRLLLLFVSAVLLTLTTSPIALCDATASMLRPFRRIGVPAYELSMMMSIALRFIPTLLEDFDHIRKAQRSRGAVFDRGGPLARLRALLPCLVPLFAQSFRHAEELALAMESRCYHGGEHRTHYHLLKIRTADVAAAIACCALLVVMVVWL
ncbi:MAG: energy-coupling factor transporter transmembrane protein EcfT [Coriobacteriales bacterium]|jgi:energy-coupling factor transport system permease protein|nr:energy-coupling factor transporter transmembrane protein EcfT [Coriobacteriales bacterium]